MEVKEITLFDAFEHAKEIGLTILRDALEGIPSVTHVDVSRTPTDKWAMESGWGPFAQAMLTLSHPKVENTNPRVDYFNYRWARGKEQTYLTIPFFMLKEAEVWDQILGVMDAEGSRCCYTNSFINQKENDNLMPWRPTPEQEIGVYFVTQGSTTSGDYPHLNGDLGAITVATPPTGVSHFARMPMSTPLWHIREWARMQDTYERLPADVLAALDPNKVANVFPHLPEKASNAGQVAFTENAAKGCMDRQSVMKAGRFIRRFGYDNLTDEDVKQLAASVMAAGNVNICHSRERKDYARVYMEGPSSCMAYGPEGKMFDRLVINGEFVHPTEVYAHPDNDLELVWLEVNGRIGARTIINTETKRYPRIYASDDVRNAGAKLGDYLAELGYKQSDRALSGQRLLKLSPDYYPDAIICPYIDCNNLGVYVEDDHLFTGGSEEADHETGCLSDYNTRSSYWTCDRCSEDFDEDDDSTIDLYDNRVCHGCIDYHYRYVFDPRQRGHGYVHEDEGVFTLHGTVPQGHPLRYCDDAFLERYGYTLADMDLVTLDDDYYENDAVAHVGSVTRTKWDSYILTDDLEDYDLFLHPDGIACPADEWVVIVRPDNSTELVKFDHDEHNDLEEVELPMVTYPVTHLLAPVEDDA